MTPYSPRIAHQRRWGTVTNILDNPFLEEDFTLEDDLLATFVASPDRRVGDEGRNSVGVVAI